MTSITNTTQQDRVSYSSDHPKQLWFGALVLVAAVTLLMILLRQMRLLDSHTIVYYLAVAVPTWLGIAALYSSRYHFGRFDLFHPLVYSFWYFYFPNLTLGIFQFIDPSVPISLGYRFNLSDRAGAFEITLYGWAIATFGLVIGYFLPASRMLGRATARVLPFNVPENSRATKNLVVVFTVVGVGGRLLLYFWDSRRLSGLASDNAFTGLFDLLERFYIMVVIVAFYFVFRGIKGWWRLALSYIPVALLGFLLAGSRAYLILWIVFPLLFAYQYAGRRIQWTRAIVLVTPIVLVGLVAGWLFATDFREERWRLQNTIGRSLTLEENFTVAGQTIARILEGRSSDLIGNALSQAGDRTTSAIGTIALFMTYADEVRSEETALGLNTNIVDTLRLTFIPRFLDPERPGLSANLNLTRLYMRTEGNFVAISYPVDLYRNFGWVGIFVGMVFVGILYRIYYVWLVEGETTSPFRLGIYFVVVTTSFVLGNEYALFFAGAVRTIAGFAIVHVLYTLVLSSHQRPRVKRTVV